MPRRIPRVLLAGFVLTLCAPVSARRQMACRDCRDNGDGAVRYKIRWLISIINESPTETHSEDTPAVRMLEAIGLPALEICLDEVVSSADSQTRMRCLVVIDAMTREMVQEQIGVKLAVLCGKVDFDTYQTMELKVEEKHAELWKEMGGLSCFAPLEKRVASVAKWKVWLRDLKQSGRIQGDMAEQNGKKGKRSCHWGRTAFRRAAHRERCRCQCLF